MSVPYFDLSRAHESLRPAFDKVWHELIETGQFIGGHHVDRFEEAWAKYCGVKHCVGLSSGTAALQLGLEALDVGLGDEVILPANTFIATAAAIVAVGATPVFVDVDPATLLVTAAGVEAAITNLTKAVIVVHLFGNVVDMDGISSVARAAGLAVIEDAAQAHGATWRDRPVGSLGDVGCFSFYPAKNLGAFGDAGAMVTDRADLAEKVRSISNHGRSRQSAHEHLHVGGNHRLDGLQAAVLSIKLSSLDAWNQERRQIFRTYRTMASMLPVTLVDNPVAAASNVQHLAVIRTKYRDRVMAYLKDRNIGVGIHYPTPCHCQPAFARWNRSSLPVVEQAAREILSLPIYPGLQAEPLAFVCDAVSSAVMAEFHAA